MRVLVTGAAGYVGRSVTHALDAARHEPSAFIGRLEDAAMLRRAVAGADAVVHLAGLAHARESWREPLRFFAVNVGGMTSLLAAMADAGVSRLMFASTGAIYGSPDAQPMDESFPDRIPHPYAASKRAAELAVEAQATSGFVGAAILRIFNVAGGDDPDPTRVVPRAVAAAHGGEPFTINGDGTAVRDYVHVDDVADAIVRSLVTITPGTAERYNIGSGIGVSVSDVLRTVERVAGVRVPVRYAAAAPEPTVLVSDSAKACRELGWVPRRSGIDDIVADAWARRSGSMQQ